MSRIRVRSIGVATIAVFAVTALASVAPAATPEAGKAILAAKAIL